MMREENFNRQNKKTNAAGRFWFPILVLVILLCGSVSAEEGQAIPEIPGLHFVGQTEFRYAEEAEIYYYEEGFRLIDVKDSARYLVVPEGKEAPEGTEDLVILPEPKDSVYMAATAVMALFDAVDALDTIRFSSLTADGWYVDHARQAMEDGRIVFAGKYSEPDYELLVRENCRLAVESTMILHTPRVQEMLENLGIPVFIDRSSYERHPLGRTEWVKVYGALLGKEEEAEAFFADQSSVMEELHDFPNTGKTIAFFYMNTDGSVVVRRPDDYIPAMIGIAGGRYALDDMEGLQKSARSSVSVTMEDFYMNASDADVLVYNASIEEPVHTVEDLLGKSSLFADFKAVQEGNVWCTDRYLYQATDRSGDLIRDLHRILTGQDTENLTFLKKVQ